MKEISGSSPSVAPREREAPRAAKAVYCSQETISHLPCPHSGQLKARRNGIIEPESPLYHE